MPTNKPDLSSTPRSATGETLWFDLPEIPSDFREPEGANPTWSQQMAHTQMLLAWRKAQGIEDDHPPRNPEQFVWVC